MPHPNDKRRQKTAKLQKSLRRLRNGGKIFDMDTLSGTSSKEGRFFPAPILKIRLWIDTIYELLTKRKER